MRRRSFAAQEMIYEAGAVGDEAYLILSGTVEIFHRDHRGITLLGELVSGDTFGEMALLEQTTRSVNARAKAETVVLDITPEKFNDLIGDLSEDARHILTAMIRRLRDMNVRFVELLHST